MKRLIIGIVSVIIMVVCTSCGLIGNQEYICEVDNVSSIEIVKLDKYVEGEYRYDYTVLALISDHSTFVDKLNHLKHSVNWGEPGTVKC